MPISETLEITLLQLLSSLAARPAHSFNLRAINSVPFKKEVLHNSLFDEDFTVRRKTDLHTGAFPTILFWHSKP